MEPEIVQKLKQVLSRPVNSEIKVLYVLVQIRKLLELRNQQGKYNTVNFYCNWSVHIKLDQQAARKRIEFIDEALNRDTNDGTNLLERTVETSEFFDLLVFRQQILEVLRNNNICYSVLELLPRWIVFLKYFTNIIHEAPLILSLPKDEPSYVPPKNIDEVILRSEKPTKSEIREYSSRPGFHLLFKMQWQLLKAGVIVRDWTNRVSYVDYDQAKGPENNIIQPAPPK